MGQDALAWGGLAARAPQRGAHRRQRERKPSAGIDAASARLAGGVVGGPGGARPDRDDVTSTIYSAFLVEEEGTDSTFRVLLDVFTAHGLPSSLHIDRGGHYFYTAEAGGKVDRQRLTQVDRALHWSGVEHIAAHSPEARGRSERMFGTLQDRLKKELAETG